MPENNKQKNKLQKLTEVTVKFIMPILIVLVGLGFSIVINNLLNLITKDLGLVWWILFFMSLMLFIIDSMCFGEKTNAIIDRLVGNLGKVTLNSTLVTMSLIFADFLISQNLNMQSWFINVNLGNLKTKQNLFWILVEAYQVAFTPIFVMILLCFCAWILCFLLRYFRVFANHKVQNVLINSFIYKRSYKPKSKTIRQKIDNIKKIQEYNKTYNSNYNNFTKYSTNLPTNKDFTFDYLEIQEYNNKNRLASLKL